MSKSPVQLMRWNFDNNCLDYVAASDKDWRAPFHTGREPGLAPAGEVLFFASPKKSTQKKGDPTVCDPFAALRGNLRCSDAGCAA